MSEEAKEKTGGGKGAHRKKKGKKVRDQKPALSWCHQLIDTFHDYAKSHRLMVEVSFTYNVDQIKVSEACLTMLSFFLSTSIFYYLSLITRFYNCVGSLVLYLKPSAYV